MDSIRPHYEARSGCQRTEGLTILPSFLISLLFAIPAVPHEIPNLINVAEAQETSHEVVSLTTREEIEAYTLREYPARAQEVISVIQCESNFDIHAEGDMRNGEYTSFGLIQLNLPAHPDVTREMALDPEWSLTYIIREFKAGREEQWSCYKK